MRNNNFNIFEDHVIEKNKTHNMVPKSRVNCEKKIFYSTRTHYPTTITCTTCNKKPSRQKNIKEFRILREFVWNDKTVSLEKDPLINTIRRYVDSLSSAKHAHDRRVFRNILNAPTLGTWRTHKHKPGSGRGSLQFYSFVNTLAKTDKSTNFLSTEQLYEMMNTYYHDTIAYEPTCI